MAVILIVEKLLKVSRMSIVRGRHGDVTDPCEGVEAGDVLKDVRAADSQKN